MIVADMSITPERKEEIAFSAPFMNLGITMMMKKPAKKQPAIFAFLTPFDTQVWLFIIVAWIGTEIPTFLLTLVLAFLQLFSFSKIPLGST